MRRATLAASPTVLAAAVLIAVGAPATALAQGAPPRERTLSKGWEMRTEAGAPAPPQEAPLEETAPESAAPSAPATAAGLAAQTPGEWARTSVPGVFDTRALPELYPGQVRRYRVSFRGPPTPRGFSWLLRFESVRRSATVLLNGQRIGRNVDPYTPFTLEARGLRPGRPNELVVIVDGRKNPGLPEGWWNWNGIVRPVALVPAGPAHIEDLGTMSRVSCRGPARGCRAELLLDGILQRRFRRSIAPFVRVRLRSPSGRVTTRSFELPRQRSKQRRLQLSMRVPAPQLWSPEAPQLYSAEITL
jgi:Glycosyl hydrolases family 2